MSTNRQLNASINAFGAELRSFVQRASDSITTLKRTAEQRPQAGVHDFKECLDDLEQQVADFTDEVQQLADYATDSISFEELIGHCSAVYRVNRATVLALEAHLGQYGYQQPPNAVQEPEGLHECMLDNTDDDLLVCSARTRQVWSTPTSPVSKGSLLTGRTAGDRPMPSRLGRSQPSSPTAAFSAAATASKANPRFAGDTLPLQDAAPSNTLHGLTSAAGMRAPLTQMRQQQQQQRTSLSSNTSSTPAGLLISPGVAALASKYATSSVGGSSVGALSMPEQQSVGGFSTDDRDRKSTCRDLNLSYGTPPDAASPDMPIFGRTASVTPIASTPAAAAAGGQRWQQQQQYETPAGRQQQQRGRSSGEDSTGELYSTLIHSNIHGMDRRVPEDSGTGDMDVTPPCTRAGVSPCSSPQAPPTAGRLPPDWVSEKMQQLGDLQADVTLTLSQMKRCPSRSRTAPTSAAGSEDDSSSEDEAKQPSRKSARQQQRPRSAELPLSSAKPAHAATARAPEAMATAAAGHAGRHITCQPGQQEASTHPTGTAVHASSKAATAVPKQYSSSTAADSLTAAAAAASADLETLMASLSMKYALSDSAASAGAAAGAGAGVDQASGMDIDSQPASPSSPSLDAGSSPAPAAGAAGAAEDSCYNGRTALPVHRSTQQQQQQQREEEDCARAGVGSSLSPTTARAMSRVAALGGTNVRPQSVSKYMQPAADVYRLEDIRGFQPEHGSSLPQLAALNSTDGVRSELREAGTSGAVTASDAPKSSSTGSSRNISSSSSLQTAAGAQSEHAVLQPVQLQEHSAAAEPAAPADGGQRQSRQRQQQQQLDKPKPQQVTQQQQEPAEMLTPRAARLQRRLQQQQGHQQQSSGTGTDQENTCPASSNTALKAAAAAGGDDCGAVVTVQDISCDEFGQLPSWCKSLLSVELLNGVLQELTELSSGRSKLGAGGERQPTDGFTADNVATLGHSSSKSKTIVSCLHKLGRATLQRSVAGGNVYKLVGSS